MPIFTVGHSTHSIPEFRELLRCGQVSLIVDVRTVPNRGTIRSSTKTCWDLSLASTRSPTRASPLSEDYAAPRATSRGGSMRSGRMRVFTITPITLCPDAFADGLAELLELSSTRRCAIMCAEAVWWRCHRRIIADWLLARGRTGPSPDGSGSCRAGASDIRSRGRAREGRLPRQRIITAAPSLAPRRTECAAMRVDERAECN